MADYEAYDDRIEQLHERIEHHARNMPLTLDNLEHDVRSGALGAIQHLPYLQAIIDYERDAHTLLALAPNDELAKNALEHTDELRKRLADLK